MNRYFHSVYLVLALLVYCGSLRGQPHRRSLLNNRMLQLQRVVTKTSHPTEPRSENTARPLLLRNTTQPNDDLLDQLARWDCRIRFRISNSFHLVLSYN